MTESPTNVFVGKVLFWRGRALENFNQKLKFLGFFQLTIEMAPKNFSNVSKTDVLYLIIPKR